jgi:predicted ATPase/DNA-binding SARP family transcriptional activator
MADVQIALLGPWQVRLAGQFIPRFPTVKVQALLAYLAVEAETPHTRDTLIGLLWGDYRPDSARQNLRKALQHLRQFLPSGYLLTTNQTVQFNPASDYCLDATQFTQLVDTCRQHPHADLLTCPACIARLHQAVELYRGDFLAGFFVADSPAFEEWVLLKREWLRREALGALHQLAASYEQQGEYDRAYGYAWRQVELDSVREEAHQQLMRILALSGRRSEALTQYETCRRILAAELAVEPAQETLALVGQIRTGTLPTTRKIAKAPSPSPELPVVGQARQADPARPASSTAQDQTAPSPAIPETIKILFLAAIPQDITPLQIDEEMRAIDQALRMSEYHERFDLRSHWAVRYSDLQELLLRHQPHIVHFSGHGSPASELIFESEHGLHPVTLTALSTLFAVLKDNLRCVVLNACYSEEQARAIAQHIDCVIGMADAISDTAAINFAAAFYQALGYGRSIQAAFTLGSNAIELANLADKAIPQLLAFHTDPAQVVLITPERSGPSLEGRTALASPIFAQPLARVPHNLPLQLTPFVGREAELAEITRLLDDPSCRLLTLVGPGGVGKTRLGLKTAERIVETHAQHGKFAQGIFFIPLEAVREEHNIISAIISVIADERGFPRHAAAPLQKQLLDFLRDKAILLILDNFEHLVSEATLLSAILRAAPVVKLLVTSREVLGLQEEWIYSITGMSLPTTPLDNALAEGEYDAVRFFVQCAQRAQPRFALAPEGASVLRICQMVEGMPLGIELAAAWLKALTSQQIVLELELGLDILTARFQNLPARHRSMRTVMEHSWNLLAAEEREVAARLSVFLGSFQPKAAVEVAGASLPMLATLVEKALVRMTPDGRYQMHELTRQYAVEQLEQAGEVYNAHSRYYAAFMQKIYPQLYGPQSKVLLQQLSVESDNILAAWRWLVQQVEQKINPSLAATGLAQLIPTLAEYYYSKALFQEGQHTFVQAAQVLTAAGWAMVDATTSSPIQRSHVLAQLLVRIAMLSYELGQHEVVIEHIEYVLPMLQSWDNADELALALALLGKAHYRRGRRDEARTQLQKSLQYAQTTHNLLGQATAFNNLSHLALDDGDYAEAERLQRKCLAVYEEMNYTFGIGTTLGTLGYVYALQGDYDKALAHYQQSSAIAEDQDDPVSQMFDISHMASIQRKRGQVQVAIADYQRSLRLARELGQLRWVVINLNGLSRVYLDQHELEPAIRYLSEALAIARKTTSITECLETISLLAQVWMQQGKVVPALQALFFVTQQSTATAWMKQQVQALLDELVDELSPAIAAQAKTWATAQQLDDVITWVERV